MAPDQVMVGRSLSYSNLPDLSVAMRKSSLVAKSKSSLVAR